MTRSRRIATTLIALAVVVGGLVATPATHTAGPAAFATGFWCGPPLEQSTRDRFRQVMDAGFTLSMPPCGDGTGFTVDQNMLLAVPWTAPVAVINAEL